MSPWESLRGVLNPERPANSFTAEECAAALGIDANVIAKRLGHRVKRGEFTVTKMPINGHLANVYTPVQP